MGGLVADQESLLQRVIQRNSELQTQIRVRMTSLKMLQINKRAHRGHLPMQYPIQMHKYGQKNENPSTLCICGDSKVRMLGSIRVQMVDELPSLISEELASAKSHISIENKILFIGFVCDCVKWHLLLNQDQTIMQASFLSEWRALLKRMYKEVFHPVHAEAADLELLGLSAKGG